MLQRGDNLPEAMVEKIQTQCEAGKRPSMCSPKMSCHDCAEKVAAVVSAKRERGISVAGGVVDYIPKII